MRTEKERQILRFIFGKLCEKGLITKEEYRELEVQLVKEEDKS